VSDERIHWAASGGFQTDVERYERGRPSYPPEAVEFLVNALGIGPGCTLVDLGAGTGKFTRLIADRGAELIAVEPVEAMRSKLAELVPTARVLDGTAERIPLGDGSVDAVLAAQAFHWFDGSRALPEIHRVLRAEGRLAMIWNVRDEAVEWVERLTAILDTLADDVPRYRTGGWRRAFERTELFGPLYRWVAYHVHRVDQEGLLDRVASVSYIAAAPEPDRERVLAQVRELLDTAPGSRAGDAIALPYRTEVYWTAGR
jgi:SAM-dependent methyltransferase